jgi:hypothetical protein
MNVEHRTSNIERRMNVFCLFQKRLSEAFPSFEIRYSIFCGSLFRPAAKEAGLIIKKTVPFWRSFIHEVQGFSPVASQKTAGQIEKETPKNRMTKEGILPVEGLPSRTSGSNDRVLRLE